VPLIVVHWRFGSSGVEVSSFYSPGRAGASALDATPQPVLAPYVCIWLGLSIAPQAVYHDLIKVLKTN
jgi:hypothetical protein